MTNENHWNGKLWYAYGTSITSVQQGNYVPWLEQLSGMKAVNCGIPGGGVGNLGGYSKGQVRDAVMTLDDGKADADLITLETGANDTGEGVPLGTVWDTGFDTVAGCLNECIRYLQANTRAQLAVMPSPASTTVPTPENHSYYEWAKMIREICEINRVHYLSPCTNLGFAMLGADREHAYVLDNIHQTKLGGYILASEMWSQLRNIPLFPTELPTES